MSGETTVVAGKGSRVLMLVVGLLVGAIIGLVAGRAGLGGDPAQPEGRDDSKIIAHVGRETLTLAQFNARWDALGPSGRAFYGRRGGKATLLDEIVDELALAAEARERGIDRRPEVAEALRAATNRALARPLLAEEVRAAAIPDSELRAWYEAHQAELGTPLQVELSEIVVTFGSGSGPGDDTPDALSAHAKAARVRAAAVSGADFADLARRNSESPTARDGGRLGWVGSGALPAAYEATALALTAGEISAVIEISEGLAILTATARREAGTRTFDEYKDEIRDRLLADDEEALSRRYRAFVEGVRRRVGVELDEKALEGSAEIATPTGPVR